MRVRKNRALAFGIMMISVLIIFLAWQRQNGDAEAKQVMNKADGYQIRNELLLDASRELGVKNDADAVDLWARGVQQRSGAMQAAAMSSALQETYLMALDRNYPNWITAFSSPWVAEYQIELFNGEERRYCMRFVTASSAGIEDPHEALLTLTDEKGFSRISAIEMDEGLKVYTGF